MSLCYDVIDHGACPDGKTLNTQAIQSAIDACHAAGGGVVSCAAGSYLTGSLELKSNVELYLAPGCRLLGSTDLADYRDFTAEGFKHDAAPEGTVKFLIGARSATNIAITGPGEVNARGPAFFDPGALKPGGGFARKPAQRPRLLMLHQCRDVRIEDAAFVDSPCWTFWLMRCERVHIHRIKILGDPRMINNDGIDLDGCRDVTISDCIIRTDDDCIVLRAIQHVHAVPVICENVVVSNCTLESTCQCVRVSCPSDHITRHCLISNCTMTSRVNGINFDFPAKYLAAGATGCAEVSHILFSNLTIRCKGHPIRIQVGEGLTLKRVAHISFSGLRTESQRPVVVCGNENVTIEDVSFNDVQIKTTGEQGLVLANCRGVKLNHVEVENVMGNA